MKNISVLWFYLEPYVFISEDRNGFLFYNTNSGKGMVFDKNGIINKVVKYLQNPENMYSIRIGVKELENEHLYHFIQSLQEATFGDLTEGHLSKPVIMPPILNLQKNVERLKTDYSPLNENILSCLHEVTIFVNGKCKHHCKACQYMFKQYPCCTKSDDTLDFNLLNDFLYSISRTGASVNITGGNPFQYPEFDKLSEALGKMDSLKTYIVNYRNIPEDPDVLNLFANESFRLKIVVNDSYRENSLVTIAERLQQDNINQLWEIGITSVHECEKAECLSERLSRLNIEVNIKPYYNRKNLVFFEENIFMQQEDIMAVELDRQDVFALQELNTCNFGKITVMPDGKVYANINKEPIGNIREQTGDILCRELLSSESWRHTRYRTAPCNRCRFRLICPSPSNYESVIGKPNLCHVVQ
ncbi:MAG: TIGR04150 pseudo-rSAM protein [Dysgonamonadaceae bacterium]|jgi:pseudo-rSAM protein|nr:TIGR04150 pseudo-rSAM protein [Dysgonamonadaceae bacterium]